MGSGRTHQSFGAPKIGAPPTRDQMPDTRAAKILKSILSMLPKRKPRTAVTLVDKLKVLPLTRDYESFVQPYTDAQNPHEPELIQIYYPPADGRQSGGSSRNYYGNLEVYRRRSAVDLDQSVPMVIMQDLEVQDL